MRLITFRDNLDDNKLGVIVNEQTVIDPQQAYKEKLQFEGHGQADEVAKALIPSDPIEFIKGGKLSMQAAQEGIDFALNQLASNAVFARNEISIGAPIPKPGKIICVGHNYREHILEMKRELPEFPVLFAKFSNTVIGPEDEIPLPPITEQLDYEAEFAFVISKKAKNVSKANALDYVAGYTIVNDVTAREIQRRTIQWFQGKNLDGSAPMGPCLVTADEIPNPAGLQISLYVNGELRQNSNTENLVFDVATLVEFCSAIMTLEPGDVILTGTPGGVGFAREPQVFLKDGDTVRIEVDQIGSLENRVKAVHGG